MDSAKVQGALSEIASARKQLTQARQVLAEESQPDVSPLLIDPEWQWAQNLYSEWHPKLLAIEGVIGCALGFRIKNGAQTQEPCISVYVKRKLSESTLKRRGIEKVPAFIGDEGELAVDVIQIGRLERHSFAGAALGRAYPPHKISKGTIGAFANDSESPGVVAITAMHVSKLREFPTPGSPSVPFSSPSRLENAAAPPLGFLQRGSMRGIDAAKILLNRSTEAQPNSPFGPVMGWRPTTYPGDVNIPVRMFGAETGIQNGFIVNPGIPLPEYDLDYALLVAIHSEKGDSGAALFDYGNHVLGFLVGKARTTPHPNLGHLRVFCHAGLVLDRLQCDIPLPQNLRNK